MNTSTAPQKGRIDFIDSAKGICIILIILFHLRIYPHIPDILILVPLFFLLSGIFYRDDDSFRTFLIKRINTLVIPFLFFFVSCSIGVLLATKFEEMKFGIIDIIENGVKAYYPIWFLLSLFWCNLIFYWLRRATKERYMLLLITLCITLISAYLGKIIDKNDWISPLWIPSSFSALFFFCIGYTLRGSQLLQPNRYDRYNAIMIPMLAAMSIAIFYIKDIDLDMKPNLFTGSPIFVIISAMAGIGSILLLCKALGRLPLISYIGRYSIIPLCMHAPFICIFRGVITDKTLLSIVVVAASTLMIPIAIRLIPQFVGLRALIKTNRN